MWNHLHLYIHYQNQVISHYCRRPHRSIHLHRHPCSAPLRSQFVGHPSQPHKPLHRHSARPTSRFVRHQPHESLHRRSAPSPPTSRIGAVSLGSPDFSFRSLSAARVAAPSLGSPDLSVCSPPSSNAQFDALSLESPEILIRSPTPSVSAADVTLSRCSSSECEALDRTSVYFYLMKECATAKKLFKTTAAPKDISRCCDDLPAQPMLQNFPTNRQKRSFQPNWYRDYSWLEYSIESDACYCFTCRHFPANQSHIHDAFSTTGFNNWKNSLGKAGGLTKHVLSQSHLVSTKNYQSFKLGSQTSSNVMNRLDNHRAVHIAKNRQRLAKICSTLHLLARQMVAFRGHDEQEG